MLNTPAYDPIFRASEANHPMSYESKSKQKRGKQNGGEHLRPRDKRDCRITRKGRWILVEALDGQGGRDQPVTVQHRLGYPLSRDQHRDALVRA